MKGVPALHSGVTCCMNGRMDVDVAIIGGALSGSSVALLLKREHPELKVLLVEKTEKFDRKVGEATTEVSGEFFHRRLSLSRHLSHEHLAKQSLRMWFADGPDTPFDETVEFGAGLQSRYPTYQLDRAVFDQHLLDTACSEGAEVIRPGAVSEIDVTDADGASFLVEHDGQKNRVRCRWLLDASGRAAVLSKTLGLQEKLAEHPTAALWARFRGVKDWDSAEMHRKYPRYGSTVLTSRGGATNHISGYGWWCWIIPLKGGDFSAGLVFDTRLFTPPAGGSPGERLKAHLLTHPVTREFFADAEPIEGDIKARAPLPYFSKKLVGPSWQLVGDAAGFIDPLYSPGMDYCSWTARMAFARISAEWKGMTPDLTALNASWEMSYQTWFRALYKDKYFYIGDAELMSAAYLMDITLFFAGPGRTALKERGGKDLWCLPFIGPIDTLVGKFMKLYNRRLAAIALKRHEAGCYGRRNTGWQEIYTGIGPHWGSAPLFFRGLFRWLGAEVHAAGLSKSPVETSKTKNTKNTKLPVSEPATA